MCELFAMSSKKPAHLNYSLPAFSKHGGHSHDNKSGWGIAYFEDKDVFLVKEPLPAADSPLAKYISEAGRKSDCVIAHVRYATLGTPLLINTHPFRRALGGHMHAFAHNGMLKGLHKDFAEQARALSPIGETDSELAFCLLLERLRPLWQAAGDAPPPVADRLDVFAKFSSEMRKRGSANFLYSDGDTLFVHADKRMYEENGGYSEPRAPGLCIKNCMVCTPTNDYACDGLNVENVDQTTTLIASVPLDQDGWDQLPEGVALAITSGVEVGRVRT
jgi:glutamine amidotransferase